MAFVVVVVLVVSIIIICSMLTCLLIHLIHFVCCTLLQSLVGIKSNFYFNGSCWDEENHIRVLVHLLSFFLFFLNQMSNVDIITFIAKQNKKNYNFFFLNIKYRFVILIPPPRVASGRFSVVVVT